MQIDRVPLNVNPRAGLLLSLAFVLWPIAAAADEWHFEAPRVVAVSDVHGDFEALVATLTAAGVIDDARAWAAGDAALVITGDLLDRGPESRKAMDLIMALEAGAAAAGGQVHMLLGNHEVMNLVGDLRYVADEEYAAFVADEEPAARDAAFTRFAAIRQAADDTLQAEFDKRFPPGFFGHRRAFRSDGHYGAWLLAKPLLIVVNDTAFTHGGLSPTVAELGLAGVNALGADLKRYTSAVGTLIDAEILEPDSNFYRHTEPLDDLDLDALEPDVAAAVRTVVELNESPLHNQTSPLWYRGNVGCGDLVETDRLLASLAAVDADRVVIGHTPTPGRNVLARLDGLVIEIDTGMLSNYYNGNGNALILDGDSVMVVTEGGAEPRPIDQHPRRVGRRDLSLTAEDIAAILAKGDVQRDADDKVVAVTLNERSIPAVFIGHPGRAGFVPDLAAYQLDRFLGLDMVPVTVLREVDGDDGVLQFRPQQIVNEAERRASGRGSSAWCPLPDQWGAMYVFDSLIHNPARVQDRMVYSPDNWQLLLVGHDASFGTARSRPNYLRELELPIGGAWRARLQALSDDVIEERFANSLDRRRRRALAARRDRLLEE